MPNRLKHISLSLFFLSCLITNAFADPLKEYEVKAAFVYQFIKYVGWPQNTFEESKNRFFIGVINGSPIYSFLKSLEKTPVDGKTIVVKHFNQLAEVTDVHILFIHPKIVFEPRDLTKMTVSQHVLTVGETPGFIQHGVINFHLQDSKIRFEINNALAKNSGLEISSKLLRLATTVQ